MPEQLVMSAPAKINLALDVLGRRADGYHEIDTIFQQIELADEVTLLPASVPGIEVEGPEARGVPMGTENLALRALVTAAAAAGEEPRFTVKLTKHIPPAAGLGGGSSDAAAVLRLCGKLWPGILRRCSSLALELGSDVPFFLLGGLARGRGRGEELTPLPSLPTCDVVLFLPPLGLVLPERKTATVFATLRTQPQRRAAVPRVLERLASGHVDIADLLAANALEPAALASLGGLRDFRHQVERAIGQPVALSGAGPTWFWIGPAETGRVVAASATAAGIRAILTRTASVR